MTDRRFGRHPTVAKAFATGLGILLASWIGFRVVVPVFPAASTVVFLLSLFGIGIAIVSGVWYIRLFLGDLI